VDIKNKEVDKKSASFLLKCYQNVTKNKKLQYMVYKYTIKNTRYSIISIPRSPPNQKNACFLPKMA
jgi:hypothetical protein